MSSSSSSTPPEITSSPPPPPPPPLPQPPTQPSPLPQKQNFLLLQAQALHSRTPYLHHVPLPSLAIILLLILINMAAWGLAATLILRLQQQQRSPSLLSTTALSYSLGLRHGLDADHIAAIDLVTRRLLAQGGRRSRSVTVGTWFSLGHATVVVATCLVVAATARGVQGRVPAAAVMGRVGGVVGGSVSAAFLLLLGGVNAWILYKLVVRLRRVLDLGEGRREGKGSGEGGGGGGGCLWRVLKGLFRLIDRPCKMYPLGVLFGLGFDTSTEIALLGISAVQAAGGTSIWLILLFAGMFTAGMCLVDTVDGALMLAVYVAPMGREKREDEEDEEEGGSGVVRGGGGEGGGNVEEEEEEEQGGAAGRRQVNDRVKDPLTFLYYSIVLTTLTVVVALVIGIIQLLTLILHVAEPSGKFWDGVENAGEHYEILGGGICASFVVFGLLSVLLYKPWRRRVERSKQARRRTSDANAAERRRANGGIRRDK